MSFSTETEKYILKFWDDKIKDIRESLKKAAPRGTGQTGAEIYFKPTTLSPKKFKIELIMPDYYLYLDEGVKGTNGGRRSTGRFSYKDKQPPIGAIRNFMLTRGIVSANYRQIRKIKNKALKKKSIEKELNSVAFAIAKSIQQKGIGQTDFYKDNINPQAIKDFERGVLGLLSNALITIVEQKGDKIEVNKLF